MDPDEFPDSARDGNVAALYDAIADRREDALAIETPNRELSHADLRDRAASFAGGLAGLGLDPGARVLLYLPNCPAFVVAALGGFRAGTPVSPANPQYKPRELRHQLDDAGADAVVVHAALRERLAAALDGLDRDPTVVVVGGDGANGAERADGDVAFADVAGEPVLRERASDDAALQPYTSGTTGRPKGVLTTHENLRAQGFAGFEFADRPPEEDRNLAVLPLYHITGFTHSTWQALVRGGSVYLRSPGDWDADEAMATIEAHAITGFIGVSAMFVDMVQHENFESRDLSSLETVNEGGAKLPVAVQRRFESVTGVDLSEGYGLTETTGATHTGVGSTFGLRAGTIGQPLRMTDAKVVDEDGERVSIGETGELLVRGPQVTTGYHDRPEETEAAFTDDGFFRTGDIARRDAERYYEIVDRKKHTINTAGYNVYPSEVEELLYEHEAVADAAVVGVPDERRGETVKAFVVPAAGASADADALRRYCLENLAEYKHPREIEFVEGLPRTASGKVRKFELVESETEGGGDDAGRAGRDGDAGDGAGDDA